MSGVYEYEPEGSEDRSSGDTGSGATAKEGGDCESSPMGGMGVVFGFWGSTVLVFVFIWFRFVSIFLYMT